MKVRRVKQVKKPEPKPSEPEIPDIMVDYDEGFKGIAQHIERANPMKEWEEIRAWLERTPKSLQDALEMSAQAANMAVRARKLHSRARNELKRFEYEYKDRTQILREQAREHWEKKKLDGMKKQITNDMIEDWILENFPDTYKTLSLRLQELKGTVKLLEEMSEQVSNRAPDLRRAVDVLGNRRGSNEPDWMTGGQGS
jgi:predicted RNase H-like nuclease (RuvC/YqgF family)